MTSTGPPAPTPTTRIILWGVGVGALALAVAILVGANLGSSVEAGPRSDDPVPLVAAVSTTTIPAPVAPITEPTPALPPSPGVTGGSAPAPTTEAPQAPDPVRIEIGAIGVDAPVIPLDLRADGSIEVPEAADETGWWRDGPEPGEPGPAVIYGHVDSWTGPAVFFGLRQLDAGSAIDVIREDGSVVTYEVERIEQYEKAEFPTDEVYGDTDAPVLRLVTCGGEFDQEARSYRDNLVVYASLA